MQEQSKHPFEGILLVDKPTGCTSHDVVDRVRRKLKMKRVGHAGTLDPLATGLLVILLGKATKASQYLTSLGKVYEGTLKLGEVTDSQDSDGEVTETKDVPELTEDSFKEHMASFIGDQYQTPPMYSAKKINGVPLYKLARQGKTVEREARLVHVSKFALDSFQSPIASFTLACSKGTYVRTVSHDLGQRIGCGAHLTQLRRIQIGDFSIKDSITLEDFEAASATEIKAALLPPYEVVPGSIV